MRRRERRGAGGSVGAKGDVRRRGGGAGWGAGVRIAVRRREVGGVEAGS